MRTLSLLIGLLVMMSCGESKPPAADLQQKAENYYKDHKLVEALDQFKLFVEYYPEDAQAPRSAFMIGFIYANDFQDTLKAREAYESFLKQYPTADSGLRMSAEWELKHLGQDISALNFLAPADSAKGQAPAPGAPVPAATTKP